VADQEARLARLLARHRDAALVTHAAPAVIRRDQLLVAGSDVPAVSDLVRRWSDRVEDHGPVARLRLRAPAKVDVCELAHRLRGSALGVAPNHVLHVQPLWWSGGAARPRPSAPVPAPVASCAARPVTVAVLDTGLSAHPWYAACDWYAEVPEELDADLDHELDAQAGHGTFVAGVVLQRAPSARLRAVRVMGGDGVGDELGLVTALARLGPDVDLVNVSAGCYTCDDRPSPVVAGAVAALARRTVVVACAGNAASDRPFWPAALKPVVAVAALGPSGARAEFSNHGWWVDASAPGVDVASCFVRFPPYDGYATWSGTSFAAPYVTGTIASCAAASGLPVPAAAARVLAAPTHPDLGVSIRI
jgi:hypothetical protein